MCPVVLGLHSSVPLRREAVFGDARASYWKILIDAATKHRHVFGAAVTLAIMGYHFYMATEGFCESE